MNLNLSICCNNPRNGLFQGYIENVSLDLPDGEDAQLNGPRVRVSFIAQTEIKIGRVRAVMLGYTEWYGNWCWDTVKVSDQSARRILNYLKAHGWTVECAPTAFFERWEREIDADQKEWIEAEEWNAFLRGEVDA